MLEQKKKVLESLKDFLQMYKIFFFFFFSFSIENEKKNSLPSPPLAPILGGF